MHYKEVEKVDIALLPTPIHKLENISKDLGANIFIKRDDLTGIGMGGNKVRKLEYLLKDALDNNFDTLLTYGGVQTNHGMLTAAVANKFALDSILILNNSYQSKPELSGNLMLDKILGADVRIVKLYGIDDEEEKSKLIKEVANEVMLEYENSGKKVYEIPMGGSSTLGSLGYVRAIEEIVKQSKEMGVDFDYIICGQGSKGTFSGLWLGSKYYEGNFEIIAINVMETNDNIKEEISDFINRISDDYNLGIKSLPEELKICRNYFGNGYAIPDTDTFNIIKNLARSEGIFLDPTYTGKAFYGMVDLINKKEIDKNSNVLFIHTGGYPGIFSDTNVDFVKDNLDMFKY